MFGFFETADQYQLKRSKSWRISPLASEINKTEQAIAVKMFLLSISLFRILKFLVCIPATLSPVHNIYYIILYYIILYYIILYYIILYYIILYYIILYYIILYYIILYYIILYYIILYYIILYYILSL